ncbi:MAG TPA: hypothetical protein PLK82_11875, partial [Bacteroidales bacterium]|nr:hypothetical protein [Bacteroidales bacterium]
MKKRLLWIIGILTLGMAQVSMGQLLLEENFSYPSGPGDSLTAHGWTLHSGNTNEIMVTASSITYTGYLSSGIGNETSLVATGIDVNRTFASQTSGSVYAGFLVNITSATTTGDYFYHFSTNPLVSSAFVGRLYVKKESSSSTNLAFGISGSNTTINYTTYSYTPGQTYLIVVKYTIVFGTSNDVAALFINPVLGAAEPTPNATATNTGTDPANIGAVALRQGGATSGPVLKLDGIRVGLTWADVTGTGTISPPTVQTSSFTFSNVQQTQMNVAWTSGDGGKRIVKMNTSNSFTNPADGTDPTASSAWANAGEQVIYNGSGNTIPTVTGLSTATTYWFRAYEYNGTSTATKYLTTTATNNPLSQNSAAAPVPPVITTPAYDSITATSARLGGTITSDGGAIITERGTVWSTTTPVTIADNKLAEGGTTVATFIHRRTGMPKNTLIHFAAYATNSAGTSLSTESSFTTLLDEPSNHASNFTAVSNSSSTITNTWNDNDGAQPATGFLIMANTTGTFTPPVDGVSPTS